MKKNVRIGGKRRTYMDIAKTVFIYALFIIYMIPFLLVVINSLKRKISIVKYPLQLLDEK